MLKTEEIVVEARCRYKEAKLGEEKISPSLAPTYKTKDKEKTKTEQKYLFL